MQSMQSGTVVTGNNTMGGINNLDALLINMHPTLEPGRFVFVSLPPGVDIDQASIMASIREPEGMSLILPEHIAINLGLPHEGAMAWIRLDVHSDLFAVGFTASISKALGRAGISCNVVAGIHHDHLFVPIDTAAFALDTLRALQISAGSLQPHADAESIKTSQHIRSSNHGKS